MGYRGVVVEIPLGTDGLTGTKNLTRVLPTQLIRARNLTYENGTLRKEGGTTKYTASAIDAGAAILAGFDWWPTTALQRQIIVNGNGKILRDAGTGTFPVTMKTGLTVAGVSPDVVPTFVEGGKETQAANKKLFIFSGVNPVQVVTGDGAVTTDLGTPPADWTGTTQPISGANHEDRLWGFLRHTAYFSQVTNHESFSGSGSGTLTVFPGEGDEILGACSFKGFLVVWKTPVGVYIIDTTDPTVANWKVKRLTRDIGIAGPRAWTFIDDDLLFADAALNLHLISSVTEFGDMRSRNFSQIADLAPFIRENTNDEEYRKIAMIYYSAKRRVELAHAGTGDAVNTQRLIVDLNRLDLPRFSLSDFVTCEALWLKKDTNKIPRPVAGDDAGIVRNLDQDTRAHDGLGYQGEFQTPHLDFSHLGDPKVATRRKQGAFIEAVVEPLGNWNLNVDVLWDGRIFQTVTLNMGVTGSALDSFVLDTDRLAGDIPRNKKRRITGGGRRLSFIARNNGAGQDFSLATLYFHGTIGDERLETS
jgi:hypothetical protein